MIIFIEESIPMYRGPNRNAFNIKIIQDYQYRIIFVI